VRRFALVDSCVLHFIYEMPVRGSLMMTVEERVRILTDAKPNSWLALSSDESKIVGRGDTYLEAVEDAEKHGENDPLLIKIPENWEPRVFHLCA